jgi:hypothetical protein
MVELAEDEELDEQEEDDACGSPATSNPATRALPSVASISVARMRIVVVLPAPFGPRNPNTSPGRHAEGDAVEPLVSPP